MYKTHLDISAQEFEFLLKIRRQYEYSQEELNTMYMFIREYINKHIPVCLSCSGNLSYAKNMVNSWLNMYENDIMIRLNATDIEQPQMKILEEEEYISGKRTRKGKK